MCGVVMVLTPTKRELGRNDTDHFLVFIHVGDGRKEGKKV